MRIIVLAAVVWAAFVQPTSAELSPLLRPHAVNTDEDFFQIRPYVFSAEEIPLGTLESAPGWFNPLEANVRAESLILGLRQMVGDRKSEREITAAIDKLARWRDRLISRRKAEEEKGVLALEAEAKQHPDDTRILTQLASRYVDTVDAEYDRLAAGLSQAKTVFAKMATIVLDPEGGNWYVVGEGALGGRFFAPQIVLATDAARKASRVLDHALAVDGNDGKMLWEAIRLYQYLPKRQFDPKAQHRIWEYMKVLLDKAVTSKGPYAGLAQVYRLAL